MLHCLYQLSQDVASIEFRMLVDNLFQIRTPTPILPENSHGSFGAV